MAIELRSAERLYEVMAESLDRRFELSVLSVKGRMRQIIHDDIGFDAVAFQDGEAELAEMLAIEAQVSADLAVAKTTLGKTSAMNQQMQDQSNAIRQEMQRNKKVTP